MYSGNDTWLWPGWDGIDKDNSLEVRDILDPGYSLVSRARQRTKALEHQGQEYNPCYNGTILNEPYCQVH
jgi:hypothetical protein